MRVVVDGGSLGKEDRRMSLATYGLALRGHDVLWHGGGCPGPATSGLETAGATGSFGSSGSDDLRPPQPRLAQGGLSTSGIGADLVIGGGRAPAGPAVAGWLSGARTMLLALDESRARRWNAWSRWFWESLDATALVEQTELPAIRREPAIDPERLLGWSADPIPAAPDAGHPDTEILERACERSLGRLQGRPLRPAAFLDRDGTLVVERNYLALAEDLELLPAVPEALRALKTAGFALVVISNQAGVGRGLFPLSGVYATMARLRIELRAHAIELDGVYFCPHRPEDQCRCRKPGTELIERATRDLSLSPSRSVVIGDRLIDVATGHRAGSLGVLVRTGYGRDEERRLPSPELARPPDRVSENLADAADWILERQETLGD
jgi:histidinol-phosphate phosphatase family protein